VAGGTRNYAHDVIVTFVETFYMENKKADQLFLEGREYLNRFEAIVKETIAEQESIINNLLHPPQEILTPGQKISDRVAHFGGSWKFIIIFMVVLVGWIIYNVTLPAPERFDPYPFILMNLVLSCVAALQAPVIMMSQNRQEEKDRKRSENDYLINMKAEVEIRSLHQKIDLLVQQQIATLYKTQEEQMKILEELKALIEKK
jgi:uncharacterized membrane protein